MSLAAQDRTRPGRTVRSRVAEVRAGRVRDRVDTLATEEPMQIRLGWPGQPPQPLVVTMRTPGADVELAVGFCYAKGIIDSADDVVQAAYCVDRTLDAAQRYNVVTVTLARPPRRAPAQRYGAATAACGVCGTQSLDALEPPDDRPLPTGPVVDGPVLCAMPERLREAQDVFSRTGGLHAAGLFDADGVLRCAREDVGRHNCVDKVVGWAVLQRRLPLAGQVLLVSGRVGYEIAQKALAARIPFVAAVGAPSSLAVDLAQRFGLTLVGFLREQRYVVYAGAERCRWSGEGSGPSGTRNHSQVLAKDTSGG